MPCLVLLSLTALLRTLNLLVPDFCMDQLRTIKESIGENRGICVLSKLVEVWVLRIYMCSISSYWESMFGELYRDQTLW